MKGKGKQKVNCSSILYDLELERSESEKEINIKKQYVGETYCFKHMPLGTDENGTMNYEDKYIELLSYDQERDGYMTTDGFIHYKSLMHDKQLGVAYRVDK